MSPIAVVFLFLHTLHIAIHKPGTPDGPCDSQGPGGLCKGPWVTVVMLWESEAGRCLSIGY